MTAPVQQDTPPSEDAVNAAALGPAVADRDLLNIDPNQQLSFLYKALDDNQNLIRFLDAKTAFAVALLSAMIGNVLANLGDYFPRGAQPVWRQILVLAFAFGAIWAVALVGLIVFPTTNPAANTRLLPNSQPQFFLAQLSPRKWLRILSRSPEYSRLAQEHSEYLDHVSRSSNRALLQSVSAEVLKVSYIRQIKTDRLKALSILLAGCALLFAFLMAADATLIKVNKPTQVQVQGPVSVAPISTPPSTPNVTNTQTPKAASVASPATH